MIITSSTLLFLGSFLVSLVGSVNCFIISPSFSTRISREIVLSSPSELFSEPRQPRRNLKKRKSRRQKNVEQQGLDDFPWEAAELRPLVTSTAIEAGEDYWIDEQDLEASRAREEAIKNRKSLEGTIPKEKLWDETLAPYRQNWIGLISVLIVVLATIITQFPELLEVPNPSFPDL